MEETPRKKDSVYQCSVCGRKMYSSSGMTHGGDVGSGEELCYHCKRYMRPGGAPDCSKCEKQGECMT